MTKYSNEKKEEALTRVSQVGVKKASEEINISAQTLYKWINESKKKTEYGKSEAFSTDGMRLLHNQVMSDTALTDRISQLEAENSTLRAELARVQASLTQMKATSIAILESIGGAWK